MSEKNINKVKKSKFFSVWDLLIYGGVLLVVVALILVFTLHKDSSALDGFSIKYGGEIIYTYKFGGEGGITEGYEDNIVVGEEDENGSFTIRFYTDGREGYNDIYVDNSAHTVKVTQSDCSSHKDCVYTVALKNNGSVPIICTPHKLIISPLGFTDDGTVIT